ncbi:hypothetical protein [Chamaesiphon polymorphus]|uniref:Uncharacterized protein n=1 Tax=Chamaesiphon polymorphus CCALA 037 TaxID=2107692 RepID=A0A2T1G3I0_9CYAN|nr:hypothetical protein [Chamaesiphon polymorphus]PSB51720.1 hypothetical protein C7B77_21295 [Chamaesiphon polymorphus CCALA 037]
MPTAGNPPKEADSLRAGSPQANQAARQDKAKPNWMGKAEFDDVRTKDVFWIDRVTVGVLTSTQPTDLWLGVLGFASLCLVRCLDPNTCGGNLRVIWVAKPSGNPTSAHPLPNLQIFGLLPSLSIINSQLSIN